MHLNHFFASITLAFVLPTFSSASDASLALIQKFQAAIEQLQPGTDSTALQVLFDKHFDRDVYLMSHLVLRKDFEPKPYASLKDTAERFAIELVSQTDPTTAEEIVEYDLVEKRPKTAKFFCSVQKLRLSEESKDLVGKKLTLLNAKRDLLINKQDKLQAKLSRLQRQNVDMSWLLTEGVDGLWSRLNAAHNRELALNEIDNLIAEIDVRLRQVKREAERNSAQTAAHDECAATAFIFVSAGGKKIGTVLTVLKLGAVRKVVYVESIPIGVEFGNMRTWVKDAGGNFDAIKDVFKISNYRQKN